MKIKEVDKESNVKIASVKIPSGNEEPQLLGTFRMNIVLGNELEVYRFDNLTIYSHSYIFSLSLSSDYYLTIAYKNYPYLPYLLVVGIFQSSIDISPSSRLEGVAGSSFDVSNSAPGDEPLNDT